MIITQQLDMCYICIYDILMGLICIIYIYHIRTQQFLTLTSPPRAPAASSLGSWAALDSDLANGFSKQTNLKVKYQYEYLAVYFGQM